MYSPLSFTFGRQRVGNCRPLVVAIAIAALLAGNGCAIVEKQSLVVDLPADEDSIKVVFVYEGISALPNEPAHSSRGIRDKQFHPWHWSLISLVAQLDPSQPKPNTEVDKFLHRLAKRMTLEETQYYLDKSRERQLCAYQRLTFVDRTQVVDELNTLLNQRMRDFFQQDLEQLQADLKRALEAAERGWTESEKQEIANAGSQPLFELAQTCVRLIGRLDAASLEKLKVAVADNHRWIQYQAGTMQMMIPITAAAAAKLVDDAETKRLLEELKSFFPGVAISATETGLQLTLGQPGQPITAQYADLRPVHVSQDATLIGAAGNPAPLADFEKQKAKLTLGEYLLGLKPGKTMIKTELPAKQRERERR